MIPISSQKNVLNIACSMNEIVWEEDKHISHYFTIFT